MAKPTAKKASAYLWMPLSVAPWILYPIWYFYPVLRPDSLLRFGQEPSDINQLIRLSQSIQSMRWPWLDERWSSFPNSRSIYESTVALTNLGFTTPIWILTRVVDGAFAVNVYSMMGMILTGCAAYLLLREFDVASHTASIFAVTCQALPWIRNNAMFGVTATYYFAFPALAFLLLLRFFKRPTRRSGLMVAGYLALLAATHPYCFFFSLFLVAVSSLVRHSDVITFISSLQPKRRVYFLSGIAVVIVLGVGAFTFLLERTTSETGKPLGIYGKSVVQSDYVTVRDFLTPNYLHYFAPSSGFWTIGDKPNYVGITTLMLAILPAALLLRRKKIQNTLSQVDDSSLALLVFLTLMSLWAAMRDVHIGSQVVFPSINNLLRFAMPGIRKFVRLGLVAQGLIVVLAGLGAHELGKCIKRPWLRTATPLIMGLVVLIDLNPTTYRFVHRDVERLAGVNAILRAQPGPVVLLSDLVSTDYIDAPLFGPITNLIPMSIDGDVEFARQLQEVGVRYVLAPVNADGVPFLFIARQDIGRSSTILNPVNFPPVSPITPFSVSKVDNGVVTATSVNLQLLSIARPVSANIGGALPATAQVIFDPPLEVEDPSLIRTAVTVDWSSVSTLLLQTSSLLTTDRAHLPSGYRIKLSFVSNDGSSAEDPFYIDVKDKRFEAMYVDGTWTIDATIPANESAELHYRGPCGAIQLGGQLKDRNICFGITSYAVEEIEG